MEHPIKFIPKLPIIVITGGPCGGKSTALAKAHQYLQNRGLYPVVIPEVATEIISAGLPLSKNSGAGLAVADFQEQILLATIEHTIRFHEAATKLVNVPRVVLLSDRGCMDGAAYMGKEAFMTMVKKLGYEPSDMSERMYAGVLHLQSVAVDRPEFYTTSNNAARKENVKEAAELDALTIAAWTGHPHLRIIANETNLDEKIEKMVHEITRVLGIPVPLEIEKKFVAESFDPTKLPEGAVTVEISQTYLTPTPSGDLERVRARSYFGSTTYYHATKKAVSPGVRNEEERIISVDEYAKFLDRADRERTTIRKSRTCFAYKGKYYEVDVFDQPKGLVLMEVELNDIKEDVEIPPCISLARDVTFDHEYENATIAKRK